MVLNLTSGTLKHLVIGGGKDGTLYLLNGDNMGGLGDSNARQNFNIGTGIFATGAFWNNNFYIAGINGPLVSYSFNSSDKSVQHCQSVSVFNELRVSRRHAVRLFYGLKQRNRLGSRQHQLLHQLVSRLADRLFFMPTMPRHSLRICGTVRWSAPMPPETPSSSPFPPLLTAKSTSEPVATIPVAFLALPASLANWMCTA